jgi:hypothetical protein
MHHWSEYLKLYLCFVPNLLTSHSTKGISSNSHRFSLVSL